MSAKAILEAAYKAHIVPVHLKGETQHKTLQARISEDILHRRSSSMFFRTEPGQFFLHEFISDPSIPDKFKQPFPARRRTRDLLTAPALCFDAEFVASLKERWFEDPISFIRNAEVDGAIRYIDKNNEGFVKNACAWTFSLVIRDGSVLSYRIGRYRDDRDTFANKRTIGFQGALTLDDYTLFSQEDYGIEDNALSVLLSDLDLSLDTFRQKVVDQPELKAAFCVENQNDRFNVVFLLIWNCPDWFEPTTRKLSLNNPHWLNLANKLNNLDDFEPWSKEVIERYCKV